MTCPNCNKPLAQDARFCHGCGAIVSRETQDSSERETVKINASETANPSRGSDPLLGCTLDGKYQIISLL
ncbi:MAG TPA: zinc-ribbon domain-containing protein, partial [Blastocatellia bacterium]|nr:zinc-ribbon domain-containing protein [Blastocatellia bacterium]